MMYRLDIFVFVNYLFLHYSAISLCIFFLILLQILPLDCFLNSVPKNLILKVKTTFFSKFFDYGNF
jgi:hypothetical protein